jgi:hypothetical protein
LAYADDILCDRKIFDDGKTISRRNICQGLLKDYVSPNNEDEMLFYTIQPIFPIFPTVCASTIYCGGCHLYKLKAVYILLCNLHISIISEEGTH